MDNITPLSTIDAADALRKEWQLSGLAPYQVVADQAVRIVDLETALRGRQAAIGELEMEVAGLKVGVSAAASLVQYKGADGKYLDSHGWSVDNEEIGSFGFVPIHHNGEVIALVVAESADCKDEIEERCELLCRAAAPVAPLVPAQQPSDDLPPLPEPWQEFPQAAEGSRKHYAEDQMIAYGRECRAAPPVGVQPTAKDRDVEQLINLLMVNPENGQRFIFAGPLESWGMGLSQVKVMDGDGNEWTLVAGLREGYKPEAQRNANLLRAVDEELASDALPVAERQEPTEAANDVLAERRRQMDVEGWTPAHDDQYQGDELAMAAICYAKVSGPGGASPNEWPWQEDWWKPSDGRRNLVKAGALILAEIERLDRAAPAPAGKKAGA